MFRPTRPRPTFADLKGILAQARGTDNALYQTIQEIIERLGDLKDTTEADVTNINNSVSNTENIVTIIQGANQNATFITSLDERAILPNSIRILPGAGIAFDDSVPGQKTIISTASGMNLDYLGDFVAGPVYNDGDIVVAADGIAYMCVVDGTTTPPEPWPMGTSGGGSGGSGGAPVNATYWVVSPHAELTNERALSALANGYVKSTGGEPSTIAVIPLTEGGTGATTAPVARTNLGLGTMAVQNSNAVSITGGTVGGATNVNTTGFVVAGAGQFANLELRGPSPSFFLTDTAAPADQRVFRLLPSAGSLFFQALNDALTTVQSQVFIQRDGTIVGVGAGLTTLNASNLAFGTVPTARLGSGTANSTTFLRGDQTWAAPPAADVFPSGLIVISVFPCPPGWTRVNWDGLFIKSGPTPGITGGANTHTHGPGSFQVPNHQHGPGTYQAASHSHGGSVGVSISGNTDNQGTHSHSVNVSGTTVTQGANIGPQTADAGGSFTTVGPHTHNVVMDSFGGTNSTGDHSHGFSGSGSGVIPADAPAVVGVSALAGASAVAGESDAANHVPPFIDVFFCQKN